MLSPLTRDSGDSTVTTYSGQQSAWPNPFLHHSWLSWFFFLPVTSPSLPPVTDAPPNCCQILATMYPRPHLWKPTATSFLPQFPLPVCTSLIFPLGLCPGSPSQGQLLYLLTLTWGLRVRGTTLILSTHTHPTAPLSLRPPGVPSSLSQLVSPFSKTAPGSPSLAAPSLVPSFSGDRPENAPLPLWFSPPVNL